MKICSVPDRTDINCFSVLDFFVHTALMFLHNSSSAVLDGISPHILKDMIAISNRQAGLSFPRSLTNLVKVIFVGNVSYELRLYFFGAKLIALRK